ncbi:MAG: cob(I)yrinic acid a,c-diamide adenosyltransferase [Bacteroidales bacterium]|nr:cob(I)yrinic acid a,c-diamide adenosyltransferase [Bacteroidales bacterium]
MIYTRTGDHGTTSLVGGSRVDKDDLRVEAYGTVDELNSHVGLLAEMLGGEEKADLKRVQLNLFTIQTLLATEDKDLYARLPQLADAEVDALERKIDSLNAALPKLNSFVIPGGCAEGAQCHVCRTVCRRAERRVVSMARVHEVDAVLLRYLNRLSDYLFVLSRHAVVAGGKAEDTYHV